MPRGTRTRIAKGVYRDAYGLSATVKIGRVQKERRFPLDTDLSEIQDWQQRTRGTLLLDRPDAVQQARAKDPFDRAVARYLQQIAGRVGYKSDRAHLAAWRDYFADTPRGSITAQDIRLAFAHWRQHGQRRPHQATARPVSPQTLRHRYRVLKRLYRVLDGPGAQGSVSVRLSGRD